MDYEYQYEELILCVSPWMFHISHTAYPPLAQHHFLVDLVKNMIFKTFSVPNLDSQSNFLLWKHSISTIISKNGLFGAIDHHNDVDTAINPVDDRRAMSIIMLSCSYDSLLHILDCETALDAWKTLHDVYDCV
jgi:hypothetical protein